jgi:hypothetical protein
MMERRFLEYGASTHAAVSLTTTHKHTQANIVNARERWEPKYNYQPKMEEHRTTKYRE